MVISSFQLGLIKILFSNKWFGFHGEEEEFYIGRLLLSKSLLLRLQE